MRLARVSGTGLSPRRLRAQSPRASPRAETSPAPRRPGRLPSKATPRLRRRQERARHLDRSPGRATLPSKCLGSVPGDSPCLPGLDVAPGPRSSPHPGAHLYHAAAQGILLSVGRDDVPGRVARVQEMNHGDPAGGVSTRERASSRGPDPARTRRAAARTRPPRLRGTQS